MDDDDLMVRLSTESDPRYADVMGRAYIRIRQAEARASQPLTLDVAWAEVEAALPSGGWTVSLTHNPSGRWTATAFSRLNGRVFRKLTEDRHPSYATALRALAAALARGTDT